MSDFFRSRIVLASGLILLASLFRLIPHPYNLSPIDGLALFSGAALYNKKGLAFLIPILSLLLSDLVLGAHATMPYVYGSVILIVLMGRSLGANPARSSLIQMSLLCSVLFFIVTNFGVWATTAIYPANFSGLIACYIAAVPFFHWTVVGDLLFVFTLFGAFQRVQRAVSLNSCA